MTEFALRDLLRAELGELTPYLPHLGDFRVRLDANEAPPLLPEAARRRLSQAFATIALERYPDPTSCELREAIARRMGASAAEVLVGVGSDELITLLLTAVARPRRAGEPPAIVTTTPSFVMYKLSAKVRGLSVLEVPLDAQWDIAVQGLRRAIEVSAPHLVFIASPNNPTGTMASADRLREVVAAAQGSLVVVDEAYVDYASRDQLALYREFENVVVLRTLSKIGFAALRVGWLLGRPELVRELDKARLPYNLSTPSQRLASLVLSELDDDVGQTLAAVKAERERVAGELSALPGAEVTPSEANFVWFETERPASEVFEALSVRGVLVRSFHERGGRLARRLRVTIGTPEENDTFLACLREVL